MQCVTKIMTSKVPFKIKSIGNNLIVFIAPLIIKLQILLESIYSLFFGIEGKNFLLFTSIFILHYMIMKETSNTEL